MRGFIGKSALVLGVMVLGGVAFAKDYQIDKVHSSAVFKVNHLGASNVYGMIPDMSGTLFFDPAAPEKSAIEVTIMPESVNSFEPRRDTHLKSPDFFDAKQFPKITFKSTSWKKVDDHTYEIAGDFTMRGVTKPLTVTAKHVGNGKDRAGKELIGFESQFVVDRTDYGMKYGVAEQGGLGKDVTIIFSFEAAAK